MNFNHLRSFYSVVKNRSFTLACKELNISQSTVSLQVRELEEYYNNPLLNRKDRKLDLTEAGQVVFSYAEKIFALSEEMENALEDLNQLKSGTLKIGVALVTLKDLVPNLIAALKDNHPGIAIQLFTGLSKDILAKVMNFEYHIGIIARVNYPNNLIVKQIAKQKLYYITTDKIGKKISLKNLSNTPIILQAEGAAHREIIINEFKKRNIPLNICLETEDPSTLKSMVQSGVGGAFMPLCSIEEEVEEGQFNMIEIKDDLYFYFDVIFLKERRASKTVRVIISAIDDVASY